MNIRYVIQYILNGKQKKESIVIPITPYSFASNGKNELTDGKYIQQEVDLSAYSRSIIDLDMLLRTFTQQ